MFYYYYHQSGQCHSLARHCLYCCYDRSEQDRPSANLTTSNVLEGCLSPHLDFPHDPHSLGKRLFDKRFFGTQRWQEINVLNGTLICSYHRFGRSNFSRTLTTSPQQLAQPSVDF